MTCNLLVVEVEGGWEGGRAGEVLPPYTGEQ